MYGAGLFGVVYVGRMYWDLSQDSETTAVACPSTTCQRRRKNFARNKMKRWRGMKVNVEELILAVPISFSAWDRESQIQFLGAAHSIISGQFCKVGRGEHGGLVVNASDSGSRGRGLKPHTGQTVLCP